MKRAPNTYNPEEVRRAIGKIHDNADSLGDDVATVESDLADLEDRVEILEDASDGRHTAEAVDDIKAGEPVYGVSGNASVGVARADTPSKSRVAGLALAAAGSGFAATYAAGGRLELSDWTDATGAAELTVNAVYYLGGSGGIATVAPTTAGETVTEIGQAVGPLVLNLNIKRPVLL